ncbi:hypothetical protein ACE14D_06930, partial [Streptomyces sp. Act-28]
PPPQQPPYGAPGHPGAPVPPQAPKKRTGLVIGVVAGAVALGVGAWFVLGGGFGGGLEDDGPHKLAAPETVLGGEYKRSAKEDTGDGDTVEDMEKAGVQGGVSVTGSYSTIDPKKIDLTDPSASPELMSAKSVTFNGVYGRIADPEKTLDAYFAQVNAEAKKDTDSKAKLVGSPEEMTPDGFDGLMKCQSVEGENPVTKQRQTTWFCAWADYSTFAVVYAGQGMTGLGKDASAQITADLRKEVRVKA